MAVFVLSLGSNYQASKHLDFALDSLISRVNILQLSPRVLTEPIDFPYSTDLFTNQLLEGETSMPEREFISWLKDMEHACGRSPEAKRLSPERVPLDLDLIIWVGEWRKAEDLKRPYVRDGLRSLGYASFLAE